MFGLRHGAPSTGVFSAKKAVFDLVFRLQGAPRTNSARAAYQLSPGECREIQQATLGMTISLQPPLAGARLPPQEQANFLPLLLSTHTGFLSNNLPAYVYAQLLTPKSRWQGTTNKTNSAAIQPWLLKNGAAYLLDERDLKN